MRIVLYSTGCPKCRMLEAALKNKKASYEICDDIDKMLALGFMEAPLLQIDNKVLPYKEAMKFVMEEM